MRKIAGEGLGNDEICEIAPRNQCGAFDGKEGCEFIFQLIIKRVIAGGETGSGDIEAETICAIVKRRNYFRVARQAKIIAAAEIRQLAFTKPDIGALNLLERCGFNHEENILAVILRLTISDEICWSVLSAFIA